MIASASNSHSRHIVLSCNSILHLLAGTLLFLDAASKGAAVSGLLFVQGCGACFLHVFFGGAVKVLFEDRLNVGVFKLGLEVSEGFGG